ncbi:hypothetical protein GB931_10815 [Modestobacter sp. I12A-02628]|uniref:Uncharacterized protein n=1 Tax=Goekera deserti TaxID=2497753 RepID=A0A7K3WC76_9ACTN|nr:hypothetical protein [Goekera deserti]MPQ98398.1 hypothetical protein [Goekera deserti]NDI48225.1 hypothetical protein [Goekera deserti]NEL53974.1 hypothetical protein [Goekera deserti]
MSTTDTRAERRAQLLDDPRFERYRNPRSRRWLAATLVGLLVAEALVLAVIDRAPVPAVIALGVIVVAFVLCLGALKSTTRGVEELPGEVLDERQWQLRGEAYARSYRIGFGLLTAALAVVAVWLVADWPAPGAGVVTAAVLLPFHVGLVLPTLVTATTREL